MIYNRLIVAAIGFIRLEPYDGKLSRTVLRGRLSENQDEFSSELN